MTNLEKIKNKLQKMNVKEMARTIKRIDDACEYCIYESSLCKGNCGFGIEEYLKDEEETESAFDDGYRQAMQDRWIPVSERLPEKDGEYLCTTVYGNVTDIWIDTFYKGEWTRPADVEFDYEIIAWQPLPDPWKGDKDIEN